MEVSAAPAVSPSSDERLWSRLRDRVDSIIQDRESKIEPSASSCCRVESERGKRLREGSQLLMRGLDSVSSTLSQFSGTLNTMQQRVSDLAKPSVALLYKEESQNADNEEPHAKRACGSKELSEKYKANSGDEPEAHAPKSSTKNHKVTASSQLSIKGTDSIASNAMQNSALKKAKTLAVMMATKASYLTNELKSIKSQLCFMKERCCLLEEENRRLQEVFDKDARPEEDDLVRLQLEALLAEKSRLANENANLMRENQCLHQLVEYHQLTSNLSASYEQVMQGKTLDFSFPLDEDEDDVVQTTPSKFGLFSSLDERVGNPSPWLDT